MRRREDITAADLITPRIPKAPPLPRVFSSTWDDEGDDEDDEARAAPLARPAPGPRVAAAEPTAEGRYRLLGAVAQWLAR